MNIKTIITLSLVGFVVLCGALTIESGLFNNQADADSKPIISLARTALAADEPQAEIKVAGNFPTLSAVKSELVEATDQYNPVLGSDDPDSEYKFKLEFTRTGAAIASATMSEYNDRDPDDPQQLVLLSPIKTVNGKKVYSMANGNIDLLNLQQRHALDKVNWTASNVVTADDGTQTVAFEILLQSDDSDILDITKTYTIRPGSYDVDCDINIKNLSENDICAKVNLQGPAGINREGARSDMRSITSAYLTDADEIDSVKVMGDKLRSATKSRNIEKLKLGHKNATANLVWVATTNKYFAAIVRPVPEGDNTYVSNIGLGLGEYYDPDIEVKRANKNEDLSFKLQDSDVNIKPGESRDLKFQVYIGPKDNKIFKKNELYSKLAYFHTIAFRGCCCPENVIRPLAFGIIGLMNIMFNLMGPFGNYGIVIILLVLMVRIVMHPVTKKSQVSMMGLQKLGPKMAEVKKKYANNPKEMQKQSAMLYREAGVNPVMGILPMFLQMPIWIALWTAVYTSIDIRGEAFLPFWITDLSSPDALIRFTPIQLPIFGEINSFNLLPILMGFVMYLQQKLMPHSSAAQTNPQAAQQQKMMMIMMPLMFPLMLYKGPAGVNLYIMTSIGAGVIEQTIIRKHIREKEAEESQGLVAVTSKTGGKFKKKKPKPFYKS